MRKTRTPIGPLFVLLVVALAGTGLVHGLWSESLTFTGEVNTGVLHASWTGGICTDFYDWPWPAEGTGEAEGKDVGTTTAALDPSDSTSLIVTVTNGYPSYASDCQVEFTNDGTIPWKIRGISLEPGAGLTNCAVAGTDQNKSLSCDQLSVELVDGVGGQWEPGGTAASSLRVHIEQPAEMDATYGFVAAVCVGQWNEDASLDECFVAGSNT